MSENSNPFMSPGARAKSTQFCVGVLKNVTPSKVTKTQKYYMINFELEPTGSGNGAKSSLLWVPSYFEQSYNPRTDDVKVRGFVFENNFIAEHRGFNPESSERLNVQKVGISTLQGLCGSEEKYREVGTHLKEAFASMTQDEFVEELDKTIRSLEGTPVGYVLKQQWEGSGQQNDKGYEIKIPGKYYEIAGYFYPTKEEFKAIEKEVKRFTDKKGRAYVCFDPEIPFDASYSSSN